MFLTSGGVWPISAMRQQNAAILGVALSLALSVSVFAGALTIAFLMASTVNALSGRGFAMDTLLGVMAHSALAFGPRGCVRSFKVFGLI